MTEPMVDLNGRLVPYPDARVSIADGGVVQGATVTDMVRTFDGRPFHLETHVDRFLGSASTVGIDVGCSRSQMVARCRALFEVNGPKADGDLALVMFATPGEYAAYAGRPTASATPTLCIHTFAPPYARWQKAIDAGCRLVTPTTRHLPPECLNPHVKYRSRLHFYCAERQARKVDPHANALLLDIDGFLTETNAANLFVVRGGTVQTPTLRNCLPGITRAVVRDLCAEIDIPFEECDLTVDDALSSDEAILSSTSFCLLPVGFLNNRAIGDGCPGPIWRRLVEAWNNLVGIDIVEQIRRG